MIYSRLNSDFAHLIRISGPFNFIAKHWATFSTVPAIPQEIRRKTRCQFTGRGPAQQKLRAQPQLPPNFALGRLSSLRTPSSCEFPRKKEADCQSWQTNRRMDHQRRDRARQRRVRAPVMRENLSFLLVLHQPHVHPGRHLCRRRS